MKSQLLQVLLLLVPAGILVWQFHFAQHSQRRWVGALLGYIWQFQWRLLLYTVVASSGMLRFWTSGVQFYQVPLDAVVAMSLALGALPRILAPRWPWLIWVVMDWLLVVAMLLHGPLTTTAWLLSALLALLIVAPSHYLARWTEYETHLYSRALLQNSCWVVLLLWLYPSLIFQASDETWQPLLTRDAWRNALYLTPLLVPASLLASALYEFAVRGRGTAFPYDPPHYLVTTGVYRYVSNPMQLGIVLLLFIWGVALQSQWLILSSAGCIALFIAFQDVCNGSCQIGRSDPNWQRYQSQVPRWFPRIPKREPKTVPTTVSKSQANGWAGLKDQ